jgi:hypothetical protein
MGSHLTPYAGVNWKIAGEDKLDGYDFRLRGREANRVRAVWLIRLKISIFILVAQSGCGLRHRFQFAHDDLGAVHRAARERAEAAIGVEEDALRWQVS